MDADTIRILCVSAGAPALFAALRAIANAAQKNQEKRAKTRGGRPAD